MIDDDLQKFISFSKKFCQTYSEDLYLKIVEFYNKYGIDAVSDIIDIIKEVQKENKKST